MYKRLLILLPITLLALHISFLQGSVYAQNERKNRTLKIRNLQLRTALEKLSRLYDKEFMYADALVDNIVVSGDLSGLDVEEALAKLLHNSPTSFRRTSERQFVFYRRNRKRHFDVSGEVVDAQTGRTLAFANIYLLGSPRGTTTDMTGRFTLKNIPAQQCTLQVDYMGYSSITTTLQATNLAPKLKIKLQQQALPMAGLAVEAEKLQGLRLNHAGQVALSPMRYSDLPSIGDSDIFQTLQLMPGISQSTDGLSGVNIRGGSASENLILLDGMTLYNVGHAFGLLSAVNPYVIQNARIYKGGVPAKYGGRLSGVMALTSRDGDLRKPRLGAGIGRLSAHLTVEAPVFGRGALLFSGRRSHSSSLMKEMFTKLVETPPFSADFPQYVLEAPPILPDSIELINELPPHAISFHDVLAKLTLSPDRKSDLTIGFYSGLDKLNYADEFLAGKTHWKNQGVSGRWHQKWSEKFNSTFLSSRSDYRINYRTDGLGGFRRDIKNEISNITLLMDNTLNLNAVHKVDFGAAWSKARIRFAATGIEFESWEEPLWHETGIQTAIYGENHWQISEALATTAGLRTTHFDGTEELYWEPRISSRLNFSRNLYLKGAWGRHHQFELDLSNKFQVVDDFNFWLLADKDWLKPGASEHRIIGAQLQLESYLVDVELYHKKMEGLVEWVSDIDLSGDSLNTTLSYVPRSGTAKGLDVLVKKQQGNPTGWISYSHNRSRVSAEGSRGIPGYRSHSDIPHTLNVVGEYQWKNWSMAATWKYASGKLYTVPYAEEDSRDDIFIFYLLFAPQARNQARLPSAQQLDLNISYRIKTGYFSGKVGLSLYNVFDQDNVWFRHFEVKNGQPKPLEVKRFGFTPSLSLDLQFN